MTKPIAGVDEQAFELWFNRYMKDGYIRPTKFECAEWGFNQCRFEIERLKLELKMEVDRYFEVEERRRQIMYVTIEQKNQLQSENARLRTALEKIILAAIHWSDCSFVKVGRSCDCYVQKAREALEDQSK